MGLDLGTNSVGWCVTDENNHIIKKGGKSLWGVRLFDEAKDCKTRRANRAARRRTQRRAERIDLLQLLFKEEVDKVDKNFFLRLNESFYKPEDKSEPIRNDNNYLFVDKDFNDRDYKKEYPTIYHLRKALYETNEKMDIRLIYLALAHMIKYRGNFLYEGQSFKPSDIKTIESTLPRINEILTELGKDEELNLNDEYASKFNQKLFEASGVEEKKQALSELFGKGKYLSSVVYPLMAGGTRKTKVIFELDDDEEIDPSDFAFSTADADEKLEKLSEIFPNDLRLELLKLIKVVYDYVLLGKLLGDSNTLSEAMVKRYEEHNKDLKILKKYVKDHYSKADYDDIFIKSGDQKEHTNYVMYVGSVVTKGKRQRYAHCSRDNFYKFIKKKLGIDKYKNAKDIEDETLSKIFSKIEDKSYLPRQNSTGNGVFPYQLNKTELEKILETQSKFYPFLNVKDENGTTIKKIESLLTFKIPYYVGPLLAGTDGNPRGVHSWVARNSAEKIYPWNFEKIVDKDQSAERFIKRMLNRCTYLPDCYCLPLNSLLFQRYQVLSLLNKTMVNGMLISKEDKDGLIEKLFKKKPSVTKKDIKNYFDKPGEDVSVTTSNGKELEEVNASMSSYVFFSNALGEDFVKNNEDKIEDIIKDLTIFEDSKIIEERLKKVYKLSPTQIKKIKGKRFSGWGRLSKELLEMTTNYSNEYGEVFSISLIDLMERTNFILMELINDDSFDFKKKIEEANQKVDYNFANKKEKHQAIVDFVDDCYVSPGMKRPLIQTMAIIEDVEKIIGHPIDEYYVECTRSNKAKKVRKEDRRKKLMALYKKHAKELLASSMTNKSFERVEGELNDDYYADKYRSDKFYLYLTQLGKCAYTLEDIDLAELFSNSAAYNIDHIIPQSLVKDDSLENKVLVKMTKNEDKTDIYPIPSSVKAAGANAFYKMLLKANLIGKKKYENLTRTSQLTDADLLSFVNRQLVYTNQAVKALVDVIKMFQNDKQGNAPKVIYSKAENVSDFRRDFGILKVREANNLHHAHDAYLNICVGRAVNTYFGDIRQRMIEKKWHSEKTLNVKKLFEDNDSKDRKPLLDSEDNVIWDYRQSILEIKKNVFDRFDILVTTMQHVKTGQLTEATIYPATADRGNLIPVKKNSPLSYTSKYGGKSGNSSGFYCLIEQNIKNKPVISLVAIPLYFGINHSESDLALFIKNTLKYDLIKIIIPCVRVNAKLVQGTSSARISCYNGDKRYSLNNDVELFYGKDFLSTLKKISKIKGLFSKYNDLKAKFNVNEKFTCDTYSICEKEIILQPEIKGKSNAVVLESTELLKLYSYILSKYKSGLCSLMTGFANIVKFCELPTSKVNFDKLDIIGQAMVIDQLVGLFGSSISRANLSLIGGGKSVGATLLSQNSLFGISIVVESPTGFYSKVLWKGQ